MKQYYLTPNIEVVEAIMKFSYARSVKAQADYTYSYKKGNEEWKNNVSPVSFNFKVKDEKWIERNKEDLEILGLL